MKKITFSSPPLAEQEAAVAKVNQLVQAAVQETLQVQKEVVA